MICKIKINFLYRELGWCKYYKIYWFSNSGILGEILICSYI